jgi:hypothetical protein
MRETAMAPAAEANSRASASSLPSAIETADTGTWIRVQGSGFRDGLCDRNCRYGYVD